MIEQTKDPAKILANLEKEFGKLKDKAKVKGKEADTAGRKAIESQTEVVRIWREMGTILSKIKGGQYFKVKHRTWNQYLLHEWDISRVHAHRLMKAVKVESELQLAMENVTNSKIGNVFTESQLRELAVVPEEERVEVLEEASKDGKKPTAKKIRVVARKGHKPKPEVPVDREGLPIPDMALPIWARRDEIKPKLAMLYELRQWADDMQGTDDPLYGAEIQFGTLKLQLEAAIQTMKGAVPHAVCTKCSGEDPSCTFCKGRGMISKYRYNERPFTPVEIQKMRETRIAQTA
jgi:hypothetical protein